MIYNSLLGQTPVEIPTEALSTYITRDAAIKAILSLGGISAPLTPEVNALRKIVLSCRRKIERNGWWCKLVPVKRGDCSQPMKEIC